MKDQDKTKKQLLHELVNVRQRIAKHESALKEEKLAVEDLRKSERRYHTVYTIAPLAFVTWDLECRVTGWNDQAKNLFGWSQEEVLGRSFFEFLIPESEPRFNHEVQQRWLVKHRKELQS